MEDFYRINVDVVDEMYILVFMLVMYLYKEELIYFNILLNRIEKFLTFEYNYFILLNLKVFFFFKGF